MLGLLLAFLISHFTTLALIRTQKLHSAYSSDLDLSGPQKFHTICVPRIGGVAIFISLALTLMIRSSSNLYLSTSYYLIACTLPVFIIGFTEDLIKNINIKIRLLFAALSSGLFVYLTNYRITSIDIASVDLILNSPAISVCFTLFAISGLTNAYNIIDGFNGLSSMIAFITLLCLAYIGFKNQDLEVVHLSLIMASAILGFFIWNYPNGLIFLGDGGAYLIGFWIACLSVMLVNRHPNISPWFGVLINIYPLIETLFTIYRRRINRGKNPGEPDGIHFHTLLYRRLIKPNNFHGRDLRIANAKTSPYLWVLAALGMLPALIWPESTPIQISASILFTLIYVWLYQRIVRFKTPKWLYIY